MSPPVRHPFEDPGSGLHARPAYDRVAVSALAAVLDAFDAPACLLAPCGTVLHANEAARAERIELPRDLLERPAAAGPGFTLRPIEVMGRSFTVVVVRPEAAARKPAEPTAPRGDEGWGLSPSLARVADLAVRGLSDKEIAQATGHSLATVRVYVSRIYRHLGVHNRVELTQYAFAHVRRAS